MLKVDNLNAWYEHSHVVQGVSLEVKTGEIVTIMGRNGAGKTTTLRSVMGLVTKRKGSVVFDGKEILAQPTHMLFRYGLGYVPEERRIVPGLSVLENLRLGLLGISNRGDEEAIIDRIAETFPRLKERINQDGTSLSGGEQQMLAIARAMVSSPKMILLDEPSEGIMPILVDEMFELFQRMKEQGTTILLVEQNVERALSISDRAYIMDNGAIVHQDSASRLLADRSIQERYCAV
jgi:branched-chain amino acid transport system ATP-binding protein